jgi:hypothetical protein
LVRVASGYYAIPPADTSDSQDWRPAPESLALGIAIADYGRDRVALSGISAARVLGIPPRAIAAGVVTVPARRSPVRTIAGPIAFWHRDIAVLETQKARTELAIGWSATTEQALLDLANRPNLADVSPTTASEAMWDLAQSADWHTIHRLSRAQHTPGAFARAIWVCAGIAPTTTPPSRPGRPVHRRGLTSWSGADPEAFGISDD